jgi:hypothetical protein
MYHEYFPPVYIELQEELQSHNNLLVRLLQLPKDAPMEMKLAEIATYCDMVLDGFYDTAQVEFLVGEMLKKLKQKRGQLGSVLELPPSRSTDLH